MKLLSLLSLLLFCTHHDHPFVKVFFCPEKQSHDHVTGEKAITSLKTKTIFFSRNSMAPDLQLNVQCHLALNIKINFAVINNIIIISLCLALI